MTSVKPARSRHKPTGNPRGRPAGAFRRNMTDLRTYLQRIPATHVRPLNKTLAKALGKSERQICRYLKALEAEKVLRRQRRKYFHEKHHRFLTQRVLIPLQYPGQPVFGEPWYGDPPPNLKLAPSVKRALSMQLTEDPRLKDPVIAAKRSKLMAMLRVATAAAGGDNRGPKANPLIRRINLALQELFA